jgi:hypothetical protein
MESSQSLVPLAIKDSKGEVTFVSLGKGQDSRLQTHNACPYRQCSLAGQPWGAAMDLSIALNQTILAIISVVRATNGRSGR